MTPSDQVDPEQPKAKQTPASRPEDASAAQTKTDLPKNAPLSPEEQMAQYEEALKESDWGHQPC